MIETLFGDLTLRQIIGDGALIALAVSTVIEITPIKWNPISSILSWLGTKMNSQVIARVEKLEEKLDSQDEKIDMNEVDRIRWEILSFANECRKDRRHTKDEFDHIINLHDKYEKILAARKMKNGLITIEFEYITDIYNRCMKDDSFL